MWWTSTTYEENVDEFRSTRLPGAPHASIDVERDWDSKQLAWHFLDKVCWSNAALEIWDIVSVDTSPLSIPKHDITQNMSINKECGEMTMDHYLG